MGSNQIKCVVWDLDNTLWRGILTEDVSVTLQPEVREAIHYLDERGILQSIASRNSHDDAWAQLVSFGLEEFFLYPQINWGRKSDSLQVIRESLNIGMDSLLFIDDDPFEREEALSRHPVINTSEFRSLKYMVSRYGIDSVQPTPEARGRRGLYRDEAKRQQVRESFNGTDHDFLRSLRLVLTIRPAQADDLARAEELTNRTNQLNSTGIQYCQEELLTLVQDPTHDVVLAQLSDSFGDYGIVGLALVKRAPERELAIIELFLMSCRVLSRGIGAVFLNEVINRYLQVGYHVQAKMKETGRNRMMRITYKFAGFSEVRALEDGICLLRYQGDRRENPDYVSIMNSLPEIFRSVK